MNVACTYCALDNPQASVDVLLLRVLVRSLYYYYYCCCCVRVRMFHSFDGWLIPGTPLDIPGIWY